VPSGISNDPGGFGSRGRRTPIARSRRDGSGSPMSRQLSVRWTSIAIPVAISSLGLIACSEPPAGDAGDHSPNVVLITVDALRADSVSWADSTNENTPNLDRLAADSTVFTHALTSFPGTTASMPSLMTGLFPNFEGVEKWNKFTYHGFNEFEDPAGGELQGLSDNLEMLAETLSRHGIHTVGFNTNPNLSPLNNFNQGFWDYEQFGAYMEKARERRQHPLEAAYPPADVVIDKVIPTLERLQGEPFFLWIHLMEPHSPYLPPPAYARVSPRRFTGLSDLEVNGALYHQLHLQWGAKKETIKHPSMESLGVTQVDLTEHLLGLYEGEIRFCDAELGRMIDTMRRLGLLDDTLFILTADHGEEFFDHGFVTHHFETALAEELIRIPLLIRPPGGRPQRGDVGQLVRMVDITPTILDYLGIENAAAAMEGVSLRPLIEGGTTEPLTAFFSTIGYGIVRTERWKYRLEKKPAGSEHPVERLFDIAADPMENTDVAALHPEIVRDLRAEWHRFAAGLRSRSPEGASPAATPRASPELDDATREQLEALGYATD